MQPADRPTPNAILSATLRLIRTRRRLKTAEMAQAMGMAPRTYELFEAGGGRINLERIHRFADVTKSDPYAIITALALGSPAFALRCADNKLMSVLTVALQEFDEKAGDAIAELDALPIINAFTKALNELAEQSVRRDGAANAWLQERMGRLLPPAEDGAPPAPGDRRS